MTAMRQRALLEAPMLAERLPVLYLPRPCPTNRPLLDLDGSAELIEPTRELVAAFLRDAPVPRAGRLVGAPHHHPLRDHDPRVSDDRAADQGGHHAVDDSYSRRR